MTAPYLPPDPSVNFTPPGTIDFNAQLGVGSDVDRQEWELRKQRINELINNVKARQDLASQLGQGPYQGYPHRAQAAADQLVNRTIPPDNNDTNFDFGARNKLYGAAQYYGIAGYDKIPLPELNKIVNARRLGVQQTHQGDLPFGEGVRAGGVALAEGATNAFFGTTESLWGLAQKVPFVRDVLAERADYDKVSQRLAKFNESIHAEMSPEQFGRYNTVESVGNVIGESVIAWPLWELAGAIGGGPGLATYGARMSAIERATLQGTTVAALMKGGGPGTAQDRGEQVAQGGAFAGALTALMPAVAFLANKVKASFPVKNVNVPPDGPGGGSPGTVDAEWWFEGPDAAAVRDRPGAPLLPGPAGGAADLPAGAEYAPFEVQQQIRGANSAVELGPHLTAEQQGEQAIFDRSRQLGERRASLRPDPASLSPGERQSRIFDLLQEQQRLLRTSLTAAPQDMQIFHARADRLAKEVEALQQAGQNPVIEAHAYAQGFTKRATILESPAIQDMARQPNFDEADVARAAITSQPSAAHVIQGVGDEGSMMQKFSGTGLVPNYVRFVNRIIPEELGSFRRTDLLVSNGEPITDTMASQYQQFGMFEGQQVTHSAGIEGKLVSINPMESVIHSGGADFTVPTTDLLPGRSTGAAEPSAVGVRNAPELYERFKKEVLYGFNDEAAAAGIGEKDWLSPEVASVLPRRMSEFFQAEGLTATERHALDAYFNKQRVLDYQLSQPEAFADMHAALGRVMDAVDAPAIADHFTAEIGSGPSVYDLADTKNFIWQHHPGQRSGVLLDLHSGEAIPMDHEGAAVEFLKNVNRELPDHTPISDVPAEVGEVGPGAANAGRTTEGSYDTQDIVDSYMSHEETLEEELSLANAADASAEVPTHPGVVNDPVLALPPRAPVPPSGGSPPVPPAPPAPPSSGSGFSGESPRIPGARPETLGDQFARAQRVQPAHLEEVGNRFDGIIMRFMNPMRSLTQRVTPWLDKMGIDARNLWADGQALYEGRARSHNEAAPWLGQARDIYNQFRRVYVRNGTVTRIAEITDPNQRIAEMTRMGYTPAEMGAQNAVEDLHNRFFEQQMVGQMGFNPQQRIFGYMSRVRARQANPHFTGDVYHDAEGHLGPFDWYAAHARTGNLDFREMNAERLTDHMVRAAMFEKHMAPTWNAMRTAWSDQRIPDKFRDTVLDWLDVVRGGYNPKYQLGIQGVRQTLNSAGIPATDRDVQGMWNFVFKNFYRAGLGFKPAAFFRDSIQPLFAWTRFGNFPELANVYGDVLTNPAARQAMLDRGYKGGWIERGRVRAAVSEAFDPVRNPEGVDMTNNVMRENFNKVVDYIHDRMPDRFKGGIQGTYADPMYVYGQKLGTLNRLVTGETGYRTASKAIAEYRAGRIGFDQMMDQSGGRRVGTGKFMSLDESSGAIKDQFKQLVLEGHDEEAANLVAHEWADTQFRGGIAENPVGIRSLAGRAVSMYGNFTIGYINQMKEGLSAGTVGDRVKFAMRQAAIAYMIGEAEKRSKWKGFSNWQWYSALAFAGGPLATGALGFNQLVSGGISRLMGHQPNPQQSDAMRGAFGQDAPNANPNNQFPMNLNPYRGAFETTEGLAGAASSASPVEDAARFLLTNDRRGQGGGPAMQRWWESLPQAGPNRPAIDPAFGRPMPSASLVAPSTAPPQAFNPPDSVSPDSGPRQGETYDQYRRRVLARTTWSPDTAAIQNLRALRPEVREPLQAMMKAAAQEGVQLDVSETGRRQERQEFLFQQGRSRPGSPVTWTLNSDHAKGRAADLVSPTPQGYIWIQQNAARFGFHTLGANDPGHVYLPNDSNVSSGIKTFIDSVLRAPAGSNVGGGAHQ